MYPTLVPGIFWTFCTGVPVTLADVIVTLRSVVYPGSRIENLCCSRAVAGNRAALSGAGSVELTMSNPSTLRTSAPRVIPALAAADPGSVKAARTLRGGLRLTIAHSTPYPTFTPDCEKACHCAVDIVKWNLSFGFP